MPSLTRTAFALALLIPLAGCGGDDAPAPAAASTVVAKPVPPPPPEGVAVVEEHLSAYNAHDIDGAAALLHEDVLYFDASYADSQRGRQAAVDNFLSVYIRAMPDLEWELRSEPIASGDGIAYEWTLTGTNTGTWMGIPAKNQRVNLKGMSFVRVKDGLIVYKADYYDSGTLGKQLGWQ
jgi:steroid delta-isomerase-like uncharacterized protein